MTTIFSFFRSLVLDNGSRLFLLHVKRGEQDRKTSQKPLGEGDRETSESGQGGTGKKENYIHSKMYCVPDDDHHDGGSFGLSLSFHSSLLIGQAF